MALIATASINIDATIFLAFLIAFTPIVILFGLMFYGARAFVRRVCGNDIESACDGRPRRSRAKDRRPLPVPPAPAGAGQL
jgi:hypothetical protein